VEALEAARTVLADEGAPLHWTVIQDLALRRGYLDPFTTPQVRQTLQRALAAGVRDGTLRRAGRGIYALA
jgi:hypothetical protein